MHGDEDTGNIMVLVGAGRRAKIHILSVVDPGISLSQWPVRVSATYGLDIGLFTASGEYTVKHVCIKFPCSCPNNGS